MIGLGGGTVVKRMWRDYPEMHIDAVELDPDVVDVARRYFALPDDERIRVFVDDGAHFLETSADVYDIVIVDAFDDDRHPALAHRPGFMRTLRDRLTSAAWWPTTSWASKHGEGSEPFRELHSDALRRVGPVWVFVVNEGVQSGAKNIILLATDAAADRRRAARAHRRPRGGPGDGARVPAVRRRPVGGRDLGPVSPRDAHRC